MMPRTLDAHRAHQLLLALLVVVWALLPLETRGTEDVRTWLSWIRAAEQHGIAASYQLNNADYPPLGTLVLWGVGRLAQASGLGPFIALKLCLLGFLFLTCGLFWIWTRQLLLSALLGLVLVPGSTGLGYLDILLGPPLVLALWALQRQRPAAFGILFTATCLVKWQPLIIAPFLAVFVWRRYLVPLWAGRRTRALLVLAAPLPVLVLCGLVFGTDPLHALGRALGEQRDFVANATNLPWLVTQALVHQHPAAFAALFHGASGRVEVADLPGLGVFQFAFFGVYFALLARSAWLPAVFERALSCALAGYAAYFVFGVAVHENHLFPVIVLAAALAAADLRAVPQFWGWSLLADANLLVFAARERSDYAAAHALGVDLTLPLSLVAIALFVASYLQAWSGATAGPTDGAGASDALVASD